MFLYLKNEKEIRVNYLTKNGYAFQEHMKNNLH